MDFPGWVGSFDNITYQRTGISDIWGPAEGGEESRLFSRSYHRWKGLPSLFFLLNTLFIIILHLFLWGQERFISMEFVLEKRNVELNCVCNTSILWCVSSSHLHVCSILFCLSSLRMLKQKILRAVGFPGLFRNFLCSLALLPWQCGRDARFDGIPVAVLKLPPNQ